jgi:hypothetical protein
MNLIVKRPGKYNDIKGKSAEYAEGDLLITSQDYGQSLIESSYAWPTSPHIPESFHPEPEIQDQEKPKRRGKK